MSEYASPMHCAAYVLSAFPARETGTEIPSKVVVNYFFDRYLPAAQCVVGIRHCVAMGWVQLLPENRIRLLEAGVAFLVNQSDTAEETRLRYRR